MDAYEENSTEGIRILRIALYVILPVSFLIIALTTWLLFYPAAMSIRRERTEALKLFLLIPKTVIANIYDNLDKQAENKEAEEMVGEDTSENIDLDDTGVKQLPIIQQLFFRYSVIVVLIAVLASLMFGITLRWADEFQTSPALLDDATLRQTQTTLVGLWAAEIVINNPGVPPYTIPARTERLRRAYEELKRVHFDIKYGSPRHPRATMYANADQDAILFNATCGNAAIAHCTGMESVMDNVLSNVADALLSENGTIQTNGRTQLTAVLTQCRPGKGALSNLTSFSTQAFLQSDLEGIKEVRGILAGLYASGFLLLILIFLLLRPVAVQIKEENSRTIKMLLLLPIDVIESVQGITDFLEKGLQKASNKNIKDSYQESQEKIKALLETSQDAIIVADDAGMIEVFNKAAETLFGYRLSEIMGKHLSKLLPAVQENDDEEHEASQEDVDKRSALTEEFLRVGAQKQLSIKKKDGHVITVSVSTNEGLLSTGKKFYSIFVHDLSRLNEALENMTFERSRIDKLLRNMFPEVVAEYIKSTNALDNNQVNPMESYQSATVLFADIVGFTTMCARTDPSTVLEIISDLFDRWDILVKKYAVEKIKTIGDCMMIASGVPVQTPDHAHRMIDFAIEMLESVRDFNKISARDLDIRIGINTGPVLAGLIGKTRTVFDMWGDSVNLASRMESSGVPGRIQISECTYNLVKDKYRFEERSSVNVKGKGEMKTFLYVSRKINVKEGTFNITPSTSIVHYPENNIPSESELEINTDVLEKSE
eukprot:TRINITY_DN8005_c0_g1_i1.p2 TRINITY_DN8005_c0_g1~~TRINITY_DN8005_c0_g1_i1.p2  ORF type:complete len:771 (+),score=191.73 TRINITY_DN8005_c0_g1_i1:2526-4838(+)